LYEYYNAKKVGNRIRISESRAAFSYWYRREKSRRPKATNNSPQFQKVPGTMKVNAIEMATHTRPITERMIRMRRCGLGIIPLFSLSR
jgi:hypothetical protein